MYKSNHMHAINKISELKSADPSSFIGYQHPPNVSLPNNISQTSLQHYWPWIWRWTTQQLSLIFSSFAWLHHFLSLHCLNSFHKQRNVAARSRHIHCIIHDLTHLRHPLTYIFKEKSCMKPFHNYLTICTKLK